MILNIGGDGAASQPWRHFGGNMKRQPKRRFHIHMDARDRHVIGIVAEAYDLKPAQAARVLLRAGMVQLGFARPEFVRTDIDELTRK
jgi:hypothetical protein